MKTTPAQYARALYEIIEEKPQTEVDFLVVNFFEILRKNNQIKLLGKIIEKFSDLYNRKNGVLEVEVTSARELSSEETENIERFIVAKYSVKKAIIRNKIKKEIQGGIIMMTENEMTDMSVMKKIHDLRNALNR